jgi:hypothetical protein
MKFDYDFFIMYDTKTLAILAVAPHEFTDLMDGHKCHKIKTEDVIPFLDGDDSLSKYIVDVSKDYAKLTRNIWGMGTAREVAYAEISSSKERFLTTNTIVNDLNFRTLFFDYFQINFTQVVDSVILEFDIENIDTDIASRFSMSVTEDNGQSTLYVTKFRDPSALISIHKININAFKDNKNITVPITTNEKVSLWATRDL